MRPPLPAILILVATAASAFAQQRALPRFDDHRVVVYRGKVHRPKWIRRTAGGEWRDKLGKLVDPPRVNFAGRYYVAKHSCGTGCAYYTMTDLSTGRESNLLGQFSYTEPLPKTRDGREYTTTIDFTANSRLIIVQYNLDPASNPPPQADDQPKCRVRAFVLAKGRLKPITNVRTGCIYR